MKKLKFIGTEAEVVSALGGRRIKPGSELFVPDSLAPRLLRTKRFEEMSKIKMKAVAKKSSITEQIPESKSSNMKAKGVGKA